MKKRNVLFLTLVFTVSILFSGCASSTSPFSDLSWDSTMDDMISAEGDDYNETTSFWGDTYCYTKNYMDVDGQVRYSFDDEGSLTSLSWVYQSDDADEISSLYDDIHKKLVSEYGESGEFKTDSTQLSDIWRLDSGNIMLVAIISTDYNVVSYTYLNPENSTATK